MIQRIYSRSEFFALPEKGLEAQKIRALYSAYGADYEFCKFYRQGDSFISALDGAFLLCEAENADYAELSQFLTMQGFAELFCSEAAGKLINLQLDCRMELANLMQFQGGNYNAEFDENLALSDVYAILREGFEIPFESWYLDMSHRVRHGVSRCCTLDGKAALAVQHSINGEALISQVSTLAAERGKGYAKRLVTAVSVSLAPAEVFVVCEDSLTSFYEKCGFKAVGKKCIIS